MKIYSFGEFDLRVDERRLFRSSGEEVPLTPRVFDLLLLLVSQPGRLLTKTELLDAIWPDSLVEESNLSQNVFVLRKALGESSQSPRFIRTVPTKGYRFIGEVRVNGDEQGSAAIDELPVTVLPETVPVPPAKRLVSTGRRNVLLISIVAVVIIAGIYSIVRSGLVTAGAAPHEVTYQQLTFERGTVWNSRFLPGAGAVIYNANFNNRGLDLYSLHLVAPEARPLRLPGANLLALSSRGEVAILHDQTYIYQFVQRGTLATMPVDGAAVRDLAENVQEADWSPSGDQLAIVRWTETGNRLEYPIGTPLLETRGYLSCPRISPSGTRIAFLSHPFQKDNRGSLVITGTDGSQVNSTEEFAGLEGLAWHGDEVWFTASKSGEAYALYGFSPDGRVRNILRAPTNLMLNDVAADGSVLMSRAIQQTDVYLSTNGHGDADLSWLQLIGVADMTDDASAFLFTHFGEGSGKNYSVYLRKTDGSPAVKLGDGRALALSPDGRFAAAKISDPESLVLLPTGAGTTRRVDIGDLQHITGARWMPDGRRLIFTANEQGRPRRSFMTDLEQGSQPVAITPEGTYGTLVSPDGGTLLVTNEDGVKQLFGLTDGKITPLPGVDRNEDVIRWGQSSDSVYVYRPLDVPIRIYRFFTKDGRRELAKEIHPANQAGVFGNVYVFTTPDAAVTLYGLRRYLIDLFLVKGLQ